MFDYSKLRGRIVEKFGSQTAFANKLGVAKQSVYRKLIGLTCFTYKDIYLWADLLSIDESDIGVYFFTRKVS